MAGHTCYSMLDLFVGYDHCTLDVFSQDLTTIQSPIRVMRLTCLPQGWTNVGAIFHKDVTFILKPEIPNTAWLFMDDCSIKGPATCYEKEDGGFETIPDNGQVCHFIWEHLNDIHHIHHRLRCVGAIISTKKLFVAIPEVVILGHKCNYKSQTTQKPQRFMTGPSAKTYPMSTQSSGLRATCGYGSRTTQPSRGHLSISHEKGCPSSGMKSTSEPCKCSRMRSLILPPLYQ